MSARLLIGLLWLLHFLPLTVLAALGRGLGRLLWWLARRRRHIALRNLELCFPELTPAEREALAREHFAMVGRSLLERGLLWFASAERLQSIAARGSIGIATKWQIARNMRRNEREACDAIVSDARSTLFRIAGRLGVAIPGL